MQKKVEELLRDEDTQQWIEPMRNPFISRSEDLGKAEMVAAGTNALGTYAVTFLTSNLLLLSITGPVVEKAGFVLWECWKAYYSIKKDPSQSSAKLIAKGIKDGGSNLAADIAFHDPAYVGIMIGILHFTHMNPVAASLLGFMAAIPIAAAGQNLAGELAHKGLRAVSRNKGFVWEDYYEARFVLLSKTDPDELFDDLRARFKLSTFNLSEYSDTYYEHAIPVFGNRLGLVRRRKVVDITGNKHNYDDLELSYTISRKKSPVASDFNLFYAHKEKAWKNTLNPRDLPLGLGRLVRDMDVSVRFNRKIAHDDELRMAMDEVFVGEESFHILELKAYNESKEFFEAMHYVLRHYPVMTTNHPKMRVVQSLTNP